MSFDPQEYDLEVAYAAQPDEVTAAVISAAASAAAAEVAQLHATRHDEELNRIRQGQVQSASLTAQTELEAKYGAAEYQQLIPAIQAKIDESPHLLPEAALTSPIELTRALDQIATLAKLDKDQQDKADYWERMKQNNPTLPRIGW